jgi:hypothetical protein
VTVALQGSTINRYIGLSADTKPTAPPVGSLFFETDTLSTYVYDGAAWQPMQAGPFGFLVHKTVTFTGAANLGAVGAVPLYTVTGEIEVVRLVPSCTVDLTEAAPTATLALGVTGSTALFVAATTGTAIDAGEFWMSTTPTANGLAIPAALKEIAITDNIIGTVAAQAVNGGAIRLDLWWRPLSANGLAVAAA